MLSWVDGSTVPESVNVSETQTHLWMTNWGLNVGSRNKNLRVITKIYNIEDSDRRTLGPSPHKPTLRARIGPAWDLKPRREKH